METNDDQRCFEPENDDDGKHSAGSRRFRPWHAHRRRLRPAADPYKPVPIPAQVAAKEGLAQLADTRLFYWDTGGDGQPIVLMHPASGSALIWGYQQPVFAKAGYRVIAYSRRGHNGSDPGCRTKTPEPLPATSTT